MMFPNGLPVPFCANIDVILILLLLLHCSVFPILVLLLCFSFVNVYCTHGLFDDCRLHLTQGQTQIFLYPTTLPHMPLTDGIIKEK